MESQRIIDSVLALTFMAIVTPIIGSLNAYIIGLIILLIWWFSDAMAQRKKDKSNGGEKYR